MPDDPNYIELPSGVRVLADPPPTGSGGQVLNDNFRILGERSVGYVHNQPTPSTLWRINHGLGKPVVVTVIDSAGTVCYGGVTFVDNSTIEVSFSVPFGGRALVV